MGYRHYLYKIDKEIVKDIQGKTFDELWDKYTSEEEKAFQEMMRERHGEEKYLDIDFFKQEQIFEFGKLYFEDTAERIYETGRPLFDNKDIQEYFADYQPYIVTKEALKIAIEIYEQKIINYYKGLFEKDEKLCEPFFRIPFDKIDKSIQEKCVEHCRNQLSEWLRGFAINKSEKDEKLTNSWQYEYEIFELLRLYKTFDFNKYDLLFYGW